MDIIIAPSGAQNLVIKPMASPDELPEAAAAPVLVEVYMKRVSEPIENARIVATHGPGAQSFIDYNPNVDEYVHIWTRTFSATGTPDYATPKEAFYANAVTVLFRRETSAPVVTQVGASTNTLITLAIDNYSDFSTARKVRTADDEAMTVNVNEQIAEVPVGQALPRLHDLVRDDGGTGTRTVYVRVSHSSGAGFSAESDAQAFTFADSTDTGGTVGDTDPFPRHEYTIS